MNPYLYPIISGAVSAVITAGALIINTHETSKQQRKLQDVDVKRKLYAEWIYVLDNFNDLLTHGIEEDRVNGKKFHKIFAKLNKTKVSVMLVAPRDIGKRVGDHYDSMAKNIEVYVNEAKAGKFDSAEANRVLRRDLRRHQSLLKDDLDGKRTHRRRTPSLATTGRATRANP